VYCIPQAKAVDVCGFQSLSLAPRGDLINPIELPEKTLAHADLAVEPIDANFSLKDKIYDSLKQAITTMNIYAEDAELRLDERRLSEKLEISRTPVREALARLEQEGLVHIVPRRGVYIVRKTKVEILEMVTVWAALESMAARLICENAGDDEIASLRKMFSTFEGDQVQAHIDEYSETNIEFHQAILSLSHCDLLRDIADNLFIHMRSIRARTISDGDRADRSIIDHMHIIEALESRDSDLAARLVREHSLNLAAHIEKHVDYLE
jgi:DNA-binding GntR family transcriptional regulator